MHAIWSQILDSLRTYAPSIIGAIIILIVGWFVAKIISSAVRRGLGRTKLGHRIIGWLGGGDASKGTQVERRIAKGVYYLIMLLVLVAIFQVLNLTIATEPINSLLNTVFKYIPNIVGAGILLLIAWILASVLKIVITKVLSGAQVDERFGESAGIEEEKRVSLSKMLGDVVYWLVFLFFLPAILGALKLEGLLSPVQSMIDKALAFVPNLFIALIILLVGWFVARVVRMIVTNLLTAAGVDGVSEKIGLGDVKLSAFLGTLLYVLILIPVLIAALNALQIEAITQPTSNMLNVIVTALPNIFAAAIVVVVAYLVGRLVAKLIAALLAGFGFNSIMVKLGVGKEPVEGKKTPSEVAGYVVMIAIILFAVTAALHLLGFVVLTELMASFLVFAGHVILGLIILALGLYLASILSKAVQSSGTPQAGILSMITRVAILLLTSAIALRQMGFANEIVNLAFGLLLGAVALATAIAFGVGGREYAASRLEEWHKSAKSKES
jgi:hypothetical protein